MEMMDQIFVDLKHWLVLSAPAGWQPFISALISVAALIGVFASLFALTTILERKGLGGSRIGMGRTGLVRSVCCNRRRTG